MGNLLRKGVNDLTAWCEQNNHMELISEWNYQKNNNLTPDEVSFGSGKKVWWICNKGHDFEAIINNRVKGRGCPYCSVPAKQVLSGFNDLQTKYPEIASEWNHEKNGDLKPNMVLSGSSKKVWWTGKCGHIFEQAIGDRVNGGNCPYCSSQKLLIGFNDLATKHPELVSEWNFEKNYPITPKDIMPSSGKEVWWICSKGHEWRSSPNSREKNGCPFCSNKRVLSGFNDLASCNAKLAKQWNYEKNVGLTDKRGLDISSPDKVTAGSGQIVWWKCDKGHEWKSTVANRTNGNGCPFCGGQGLKKAAKQRVIVGENDLATVNPALAKEWDFEKNRGLTDRWGNDLSTPDKVLSSSEREVWWICPEGHSWKTAVNNRVNKNYKCYICSGRSLLPRVVVDLATDNPELASEWNYDKNYPLLPNEVSSHSNKKVWWKCKRGHEWESNVSNRSRGHGCPFCAGQRVIKGENDLLTNNPSFLSEWDYDKNAIKPDEVTIASPKKIWWKCQFGHEWQTAVYNRSIGSQCPYCTHSGSSLPEQGISFYLSQVCNISQRVKLYKKEVDVYIAEYNIAVEYDGMYYHKNKEAKDKQKEELLNSNGVILLRIIESKQNLIEGNHIYFDNDYMGSNYEWALKSLFGLLSGYTQNELFNSIEINIKKDRLKIRERFALLTRENSFGNQFPETSKEWNIQKNGLLTPFMFPSGSDEKVWWICSKGHEWEASLYSRSIGMGCPYCSGRRVLKGETDLATLAPDIAKEWNYDKNESLTPSDIGFGSNLKVWWKCSKGHEWQANIVSRTKRNIGCPYCSNHLILKGYNDLATIEPEIAKEWNYAKNEPLTPYEVSHRSGKKVWWTCSNGHDYTCVIAGRTGQKLGCPYCSGRKVLKGETDLATLAPDIAKEWNYDKNESLTPSDIGFGSNLKVWWKCSKGHEWKTMVITRTKGAGCPYCSNQKVISGFNDLATLRPDLIKEWNYEKNKGLVNGKGHDISKPELVTLGSNKKVWWICENGHEWEAIIASRVYGGGCPYCNNSGRKNKTARKIQCVETGVVFSSNGEAAAFCGIKNKENISDVCRGSRKSAGGYHWRFIYS